MISQARVILLAFLTLLATSVIAEPVNVRITITTEYESREKWGEVPVTMRKTFKSKEMLETMINEFEHMSNGKFECVRSRAIPNAVNIRGTTLYLNEGRCINANKVAKQLVNRYAAAE